MFAQSSSQPYAMNCTWFYFVAWLSFVAWVLLSTRKWGTIQMVEGRQTTQKKFVCVKMLIYCWKRHNKMYFIRELFSPNVSLEIAILQFACCDVLVVRASRELVALGRRRRLLTSRLTTIRRTSAVWTAFGSEISGQKKGNNTCW